jgi:hypothetical protein
VTWCCNSTFFVIFARSCWGSTDSPFCSLPVNVPFHADAPIPTPSVTFQVSIELSKEDAANYAVLERQSQALVQAQAAAGSLMQNLTHVLAVLMRLRQVRSGGVGGPGAPGTTLLCCCSVVVSHCYVLRHRALSGRLLNMHPTNIADDLPSTPSTPHNPLLVLQVCDSSYLAAGPLAELKALLASSSKAPAADPALLEKLAAILAANNAAAAAAAAGGGEAGAGAGGAGGDEAEECPVCLSPLDAPCITSCGHVFCRWDCSSCLLYALCVQLSVVRAAAAVDHP